MGVLVVPIRDGNYQRVWLLIQHAWLSNDVLGNSVLFIGYSLTDINIRLLFYRLAEMWGRSTLSSARPKSYVFTNRPNPVAQESE